MLASVKSLLAKMSSNGKKITCPRGQIHSNIVSSESVPTCAGQVDKYFSLALRDRNMIMNSTKMCYRELDPGLEEAIASIIWATPRLQTDVQELKMVADVFTDKYGKEFAQACRTNELNNVNEKVMHKLGVQAPAKILVERYMIEIAKTYNVPFEPDPSVMNQDEIFAAENLLIDLGEKKCGGGGGGGPSGGMGVLQPQGGGASAPYPPSQPSYPPPTQYPQNQEHRMPPPLPQAPPAGGIGAGGFVDPSYPPPQVGKQSYDDWVGEDPKKTTDPPAVYNPPPAAGFNPDSFPELPAVPNSTLPDPGNSVGGSSAGGDDVDFDDLTRRFEQLKKRK